MTTVGGAWNSHAVPPSASTGLSVATWGSQVWLNQTGHQVMLWHSSDAGRHFSQSAPRALGSVVACRISPEAASSLWAECPTGMMLAFAYSSDAGRTWHTLATPQMAGTGGGGFDPFSPTLAYLDLGQAPAGTSNLYRLSPTSPPHAVGHLPCTSLASLQFTSPTTGVALCASPLGRLLATSDGGSHWRVLA